MMPGNFREAMEAAGLAPPPDIVPGKFHRFPGANKGSRNSAAWCKLFPDGEGGVFGDFATGMHETWQAKRERPMTPAERETFTRQCLEAERERRAEEERRHNEARAKARAVWQAAEPASTDHPYLVSKGIEAHGARLHKGALVVPVMEAGELHSLQFIAPDGAKRFLAGGRVEGCYCPLGKPGDCLVICEGFATGANIREATGHAVAVAFNAGNLAAVARSLRERFPELRLIVAADDDAGTSGNPGITKATEAAREAGALLAVPDFGKPRPDGVSDFNDLARLLGAEEVRACLAAAHTVALQEAQTGAPRPTYADPPCRAVGGAVGDWPELLPLVAEARSTPYPVEALPGVIGDAVREVVGFVQCPEALAACSALGAVSLVTQGLADVRRAEGLEGPTSLYFLAIAESGERKTATDNHFLGTIREWEASQAEEARPHLARYAAELAAWEAKRDGLLLKVKENSRKNKPCDGEERGLRELEDDKPTPPKVPRLLFGEATPEALAWKLATGWPSAGVISSEAGIVFGGHANRPDSVMRNLAQLNVLWDGGTLPIDRRTSDSFTLRGARLTMGLAAQPDTARAFLEATKGLARGTGFTARFLVAWPESTQGTRVFRDPPADWPALSAFRRRLAQLLTTPLRFTEAGILAPTMLHLAPDAKAAWVEFANDVEVELRPGGDMEGARDVASKAADNCARLAALFHVFERGPEGEIEVAAIDAAARVVSWHLYEARRFLGEIALPSETINAVRLDTWLVEQCRASGAGIVPTRDALRRGPNPTRRRDAMKAALAELAEAGRARQLEEGRRRLIEVRPELLAGGNHGTS